MRFGITDHLANAAVVLFPLKLISIGITRHIEGILKWGNGATDQLRPVQQKHVLQPVVLCTFVTQCMCPVLHAFLG